MLNDQDLQDEVTASCARSGIPGISAAVYFRGATVAAASGFANLRTSTALSADTLMHIGSITKVLTATLVMQLVDEGRIGLDQRVVELIPDFALGDSPAARALTVRMLLNHTSGIDADLLPDAGPDRERIEDAVVRFRDAGQLFAPGSDCSYSNPGAVIAGYLAERVHGRSWYALVREQILQPLGMGESALTPAEAILRRASVGHRHDSVTGKAITVERAFLPFSYAPAGASLMMSARDLLKFVVMHVHDGEPAADARQIVSAAGARAMRETSAQFWGPARDRRVGLGWMLTDQNVVTHSGGGPGVACCAFGDAARDFAAVVLTNSDRGAAAQAEIIGPIAKALCGLDLFPQAAAAAVPDTFDAGPYVGTYASSLLSIRIEPQPQGLLAHLNTAFSIPGYDALPPVLPLQPIGAHRFAVRDLTQLGQALAFGRLRDGRFQFASMGSPARLLRRRDIATSGETTS